MSKQTNAFQKLIFHIHKKIKKPDTTVSESADLRENNIDQDVNREVDVLIEEEINGVKQKIAIECRDHKAKNDILWVDSLIGKYKNLDVDKVVAVSNSGFSKNAYLKAKAENIILKTLQEAMQIDFGKDFRKLGMIYISHTFKLVEFSMSIEPKIKKEFSLKTPVYADEDGENTGTLEWWVDYFFKNGPKKNLIFQFKENMLEFYKKKSDVGRLQELEHITPIKGLYVELEGKKHTITSIKFVFNVILTTQEIHVGHRTYEGALISEGVFDIEGMDKIHTTWIAQLPKDKDALLFVKSKQK